MNKQNQKIILKTIRETATQIADLLPETPKHPKGRNAYAHIPNVIASILGSSYKDLDDEYFDSVMMIIKHCEENPF
jgi:hypothetical protein